MQEPKTTIAGLVALAGVGLMVYGALCACAGGATLIAAGSVLAGVSNGVGNILAADAKKGS